jgi:hypothetical protein
MGAPLYHYTGQVGPRFGNFRSLVNCKMVLLSTVEADIHLRLLPISSLDIHKVFEPLVCCLKGIWLQPYTVTPAKLAPDLGTQGHLWREHDATVRICFKVRKDNISRLVAENPNGGFMR